MSGLSIARCFDNGVKVLQTYASTPGGHAIMAVKRDGAACYSLEIFYPDAAANVGVLIYKDAAGADMVTFSGQTPDEICFGTATDLPAELAAARDLARGARLAANRGLSPDRCRKAQVTSPESAIPP